MKNNIFEVYESKWKTILIFLFGFLFFIPCLFIIYFSIFGMPQNELTNRLNEIIQINQGFWTILFGILFFGVGSIRIITSNLKRFQGFKRSLLILSNIAIIIFCIIVAFIIIPVTDFSTMGNQLIEILNYLYSKVYIKFLLIMLVFVLVFYLLTAKKLIFAINNNSFYTKEYGWISFDEVLYIKLSIYCSNDVIIFDIKNPEKLLIKMKKLNRYNYHFFKGFTIFSPVSNIKVEEIYKKLVFEIKKYKNE